MFFAKNEKAKKMAAIVLLYDLVADIYIGWLYKSVFKFDTAQQHQCSTKAFSHCYYYCLHMYYKLLCVIFFQSWKWPELHYMMTNQNSPLLNPRHSFLKSLALIFFEELLLVKKITFPGEVRHSLFWNHQPHVNIL